MLGLDYSAGRPDGAAVIAAGYGFVARYLDNGLRGRVNVTTAELANMQRHGVAVVFVWESAATRAAAGRDAGVADARAADAAATTAGAPGAVIYFAVDYDIPDAAPASTDPRAKLGTVAAYFDGVTSVLGVRRTGVYGGYWAVSRILDAGLATYAWQTAAWSGSNVDTRIHLYQRIGTVTVDGVACDVNEARRVYFGQYGVAVRQGGNNVATFIKNMDTDEYATQDGPLVSGVREEIGKATLAAWPGASCEIGLNDEEFRDRVNKSKVLEGLADAIAALPAAIAQALPVGTGNLSAAALTAAVAEGVRSGLEGVTESTTLHKPST